MATITVWDIVDEVHRALSESADRHGPSLETEVRSILEQAVTLESRHLTGAALVEIWGVDGLTKGEADLIENARDRTLAEPMNFDHIAIAPSELSAGRDTDRTIQH